MKYSDSTVLKKCNKLGTFLKQDVVFCTTISIGYLFLLLHLVFCTANLLWSLYRLDYTLLITSPIYRCLLLFFSPVLWIVATGHDYFNYYRIKKISYVIVAFNEVLLLLSIAFQLLSMLALPAIMSIHTDMIFTKNMVLLLARIITELPLLLLGFLLVKSFLRPIKEDKSCKAIMNFKISYYLNTRDRNTEIEYTLSIVRDIKTGKSIPVSEKDRFLHTLIDGTSGTGKTSSTILPAIKDDLNMRCQAEEKQMSLLSILAKEGKIKYDEISDFFSINNFKPLKSLALDTEPDQDEESKIRKQLDEIRLKYPVCGITVLAPDDSLTDDVCRLCENRGIPYHRIDANRTPSGQVKSCWTGMNPFFLPEKLDEEIRHQLIVKKAIIFSDVMQVITDLKGKADSYFTGLNRQMIANLAILAMNTVPLLNKRHATPADLQSLINNFDRLPEYVDMLAELDAKANRYTFIIQYIKDDLLGKGRVKMEDQSRGTRNIINEFLLMPGSKEVFCSQSSLDFNKILENGEVTVCNYNLASGDSNAVAFGLFFLLSFNNAVLSRPGTENTRTPHFFYIDELPVLIHSSLEKNFSLFRKFKVAMFSAIQTLDQFEKNEITKYLKGVVLGCAHIMVFGRSSLSDMEVFSAMAGIRDEIDEQTMTSETSISDDSPTLSYSSRETAIQKNAVEEVDIRMKDFQEVTFFTTRCGRPLSPFHGRVEFLKSKDWEPANAPIIIPDVIHHNTDRKQEEQPVLISPYNFSNITETLIQFSSNTTSDRNDPIYDIKKLPPAATPETTDNNTIPEGSESLDELF